MEIKLWLDDTRNPVFYTGQVDWTWVQTASEAIRYLERHKNGELTITECSLDHDLAYEHYQEVMENKYTDEYNPDAYKGPQTGYHVTLWMAEHNVWPEVVRVHSMNPVGAEAMRQVITRYKCS